MKRIVNILLAAGFLASLALILQYFWNIGEVTHIIARIAAGFCIQLLLCRLPVPKIVKAIPAAATGLLTLWGTYLYIFSPSWSNATIGGLIGGYVTPFLGCAAAIAVYISFSHIDKKTIHE